MTNEEIVLKKISNRFLGSKPIKFADPKSSSNFWGDTAYKLYIHDYNNKINKLKNSETVLDRVDNIIEVGYETRHLNNRYQCHSGARRSTCDIWRIYKYYFGEIDIFSIMRALYQLVINGTLNTYRCNDVRKRVFWYSDYREKNLDVAAELGIPLMEWEKIGLNET